MSTAGKVAKHFSDNGQIFTDRDGNTLDDIAKSLGGKREIHPDSKRDLVRYTFKDKSAIVVAGGAAWDFEGRAPWSWQGGE
jgi:hypothetical protein